MQTPKHLPSTHVTSLCLWAKGYFHSTRLMQALRIGLLRVRQNRARGGLLLVDPPCFLLLAYCCLFLCASEPTGGGPVVQTAGCEPASGLAASPCACRAALMAACQARTELTPELVPQETWMPLLGPRRPWEEPTGLPVLAGACSCTAGLSWYRRVLLSDQSAEASVEGVVLLLSAYCAPGGRLGRNRDMLVTIDRL